MLRRLCAFIARQLVAPSSACILRSALLAVCLASWCLQFVTLLGASLPVTLGILGALTLGIGIGAMPIAAMRRLSLPGVTTGTLLNFAMAAWMVASPCFLQLVDWALAQPGFISLTSPVWNCAAVFALAVICLGFPAFLTAQLAADPDSPESAGTSRIPLVFLGAAVGLAIWGVGLAQIIGPYHCAILTAGMGLAISLYRSYRMPEPAAAVPVSWRSKKPVLLPELHPVRELSTMARLARDGALGVAFGGWLAALGRLLEQLMPATVYLTCSIAVGLCLGMAAGLWLAARLAGRTRAFEHACLVAVCAVAATGVILLPAFPLCTLYCLWLNAYASSPTLLILGRGALAGLAVLPLGATAALCQARACAAEGQTSRSAIPRGLVAMVLGYGVVSGWAFSAFSPELIIVGLAWCLFATAAVAAGAAAGRSLLAGWPQRILLGGSAAVIVIAPLWRDNFDVRRSAKLLFNSNVTFAFRTGMNPSLLASLDEGRHIATRTGVQGIHTVWRFGGHQLQIRENGIPVGIVSTDAEKFPKYIPEILQAALPLTLHEKPERLLLLGLGSSESLTAGLAFPIHEIVCVEGDRGLVQVVNDIVAADSGANPLTDERLALSICDPAVGVAAAPGRYDAIVSSPGHIALSRAQPYVTAEFYRRAARKLTAEGVFCQHLQCVDIGPRPLQAIVMAMQSAFRHVLALEAGPGEFVLAATNDTRGLIRPGLSARLELPHVRALLAQSGVDWTVVLNLGAFDNNALEKFAGSSSTIVNSTRAGRLPFALPRDVMRWGPKLQEVNGAFGNSRRRLLAWIGDDGDTPVLLRRLAEVQGQFDLMSKYSDQYWAYRSSLRSQVKEKPRSQIQQVSATDDEKKLHPEDRRRLRYFQALGRAARTAHPADIERLSRYASPYDPLISYFVHEEAAELYARSAERDVVEELRNRLYVTFFSSPRDASLRNVVATLKLLREHPEAEPDLVRRWDVFNSLLQALKLRWEARTGFRPTNVKEIINDIDATMLAADETFRVLDRLTAEAGLPACEWTNRRSVLEKNLIKPVKAYQLELLPHLHQRQAKLAQAVQDVQEEE